MNIKALLANLTFQVTGNRWYKHELGVGLFAHTEGVFSVDGTIWGFS